MIDPDAVLVVIPARDEQRHVGACVTSVRRSVEASGVLASAIVVVADRCRDRTADAARRALGSAGIVIATEVGSAGAARHLGVEVGVEHLGRPVDRIWIANTDADSRVPPQWLRAQLDHAAAGAAAVAGIVRLHHSDPVLAARFHHHYRWERHRPHPHVHGANLGVHGHAYRSVGGWPRLPLAEDHALWNALVSSHWPTISATDVWVWTSPRVHGRVRGGFADDLRALAGGDDS